MHTNTTVLEKAGIDLSNIEFPELEIPVLTGCQRQGDVLIVPATKDSVQQHQLRIADGPEGRIVVVRSEATASNTHSLVGNGYWAANPAATNSDELVQGWVTVDPGSEVFLIHTEEHNAIGIGPGCYEVRRQREFAGEWQRVSD